RVAKAASSFLGTILEVGHEALLLLSTTTDLLKFTTIAGLRTIARTPLQWDSLQLEIRDAPSD
ncbi:hypothetical protein BDZ89DRAFT_1063426, partial [Hymenopellis radicata]